MKFRVDFTGVSGKQDIIKRLADAFKLPDDPSWTWNWDAFMDYFTNLDSDSDIVREANPMPTDVHLIVKNIEAVKVVSLNDYEILISALEDVKDPENRGDDIKFTYEKI